MVLLSAKKILIDIESQNNRITVRFRWFDHIITISLRDYWRVYRSRAMVYQSKDHENDLMIPQVVFLSFEHPIFQETSPKLDSTEQEIKIGRCRWVRTSVKAKLLQISGRTEIHKSRKILISTATE